MSEDYGKLTLDRFSAQLSDLDEAQLCLDSLPQEINLNELRLFQQIEEEKVFILVDNHRLWIATSAVRSVNTGTILKSALNLNLKSMARNQAKLIKAGIELAKGSAVYQFKHIEVTSIHSVVPLVETSQWNLNKYTFSINFLAENSTRLGQLPIVFTDMSSLNKISDAILASIGKPHLLFGAFFAHLESEPRYATSARTGQSLGDQISQYSAASIDVWESFIIGNFKGGSNLAREITSDVKAELYEDGQLTVSYVENRLASASHGSIGLNLLSSALSAPTHKEKNLDTRSLSIGVFASTWNLEILLPPTHVQQARAIVTRINQTVEVQKNKFPNPVPQEITQDIAGALAKLAELKTQGLLTDEEFEKAKSRLLS